LLSITEKQKNREKRETEEQKRQINKENRQTQKQRKERNVAEFLFLSLLTLLILWKHLFTEKEKKKKRKKKKEKKKKEKKSLCAWVCKTVLVECFGQQFFTLSRSFNCVYLRVIFVQRSIFLYLFYSVVYVLNMWVHLCICFIQLCLFAGYFCSMESICFFIFSIVYDLFKLVYLCICFIQLCIFAGYFCSAFVYLFVQFFQLWFWQLYLFVFFCSILFWVVLSTVFTSFFIVSFSDQFPEISRNED